MVDAAEQACYEVFCSKIHVLVPVKSKETHWNSFFSLKSAPNDLKLGSFGFEVEGINLPS